MKNRPVIIIGAPRSGTNMLRDLLTQIAEFVTWDCDEINPIWKYGNISYPYDEMESELLTPNIVKFIRSRFEKLEKINKNAAYLLEKTCANSLRPEFVHSIFPEAKFIFLYRDGRDAIASAIKRWHSSVDLLYTYKKARYVPLTDYPYYLTSFLTNRIRQVFSRDKIIPVWGPVYYGMYDDIKTMSIHEVAAKQWAKCIDISLSYFNTIDENSVYKLKYEDLVRDPEEYLSGILTFIDYKDSYKLALNDLTRDVSSRNIGKWEKDLSYNQIEDINEIIQKNLQVLGYT